jgi:serine/threonine protein phosphatase 1
MPDDFALTYAVPDLHGRFDLLEAALAAISDHAHGPARIVFLGDYVDRGPQSREVVARLMEGPSAGSEWLCLAGNHEALMVAALTHAGHVQAWLEAGGETTLGSYERGGRGWRETIVAHGHWLAALPTLEVDAHRVYVHAGVDPAVPLDRQTRETLLWVRHARNQDVTLPGRHIVHGHVPADDGPGVLRGRSALDTRAWRTGRLVVGVYENATPGAATDYLEIRD